MSVVQGRGGIPRVIRDAAVAAAGRKVNLPFYISYLVLRVTGEGIRLFFTQADFDNDENYVEVPSGTKDEWAGPVEADNLWVKSSTANDAGMELVVFQRRG